ncbi:hypothetical protein Trydic_g6330 [Trypoxylus dichotomus]
MGRRGGGGGGARMRAPSPPPVRAMPRQPQRSISTTPARAPTAPPPGKTAPRQPGLFGQMAATAAGVAVGSAAGHAIGSAITGGGGSGYDQPMQQVPPEQYLQEGLEATGPCAFEIKQFLNCATSQSDLALCQAFSDAVRDSCKPSNAPTEGASFHISTSRGASCPRRTAFASFTLSEETKREKEANGESTFRVMTIYITPSKNLCPWRRKSMEIERPGVGSLLVGVYCSYLSYGRAKKWPPRVKNSPRKFLRCDVVIATNELANERLNWRI